ncbi:methyl-accepting chemotaxis protein [Photobacterium frigidiphilum]|uniref:Methyl-accepting chemotaxis protein n=1 Tax=Photobacterium frigidiphilum TaxID=264736 RepID=A0A2T3JBW1_9GAMM|nr:methyl-accepting chemotaxis protein [Photobacterium frigidiphilum]PSU46350.1 methyl-accepting chemotaxis protein [Photobacterium frigidiphilum]
MKLSIARKLRLSFLLVTTLFLFSSVALYKLVSQVETNANSLLNVDLPTVDASRSLQQSVQASMSSVRAYMLLGANKNTAAELQSELAKTIASVDVLLPTLQAHLTSENYDQIDLQWKSLVNAQSEIMRISHTEDNLPAHTLLLNEAAPIAEVALDQLQGLLNEEENNPFGGDRKRLIKVYADSYNSLANSLSVLRDFLLYGEQEYSDKYNDLIISHKKSVAEINAKIDRLSESDVNLWRLFEEMQKMYLPLADQVIALRQAPDWNKANFMMTNNVIPIATQLELSLEKIVQNQQTIAQASGFAINTSVANVIWMLVVTAIIASLSAFIIATWLGRNIGLRLSIIAKRAEDISLGDFSGRPLKNSGSDELATLMVTVNRMTESLSSLVQGVSNKADDVDSSMASLLNINAKTANETQNQANKVGSMATAIEELSVTTNETAQNTQDVSASVQTSTKYLTSGEQALTQNKLTAEELHQLIESASGMVHSLSEESNRIERVTEVIESLAQQTNLLALNAAIEAARAGEQGRGFAVVADEVRLLAQRTTDSTTEINSIVEAIQSSTVQVVKVIGESQRLVQTGAQQTSTASNMLLETINQMQDVSQKVSDVAVATEQQSSVSQSLADIVHQLSDSANDVSNNCDDANTTSQEIKHKVVDLNNEMAKFTV